MGNDDDGQSVREKLLDAAAEEFLSPDYDVLGQVVLARIAERAGVPERSARRYFTAESLRGELVEHLLQVREGVDISTDDFDHFGEALLDRSTPLSETLGLVAEFCFQHNLNNKLMRAQMGLWPYAARNPEIRDRLLSLHDYWASNSKAKFNEMLVDHSDVFRFRPDWISVDDFVRVLTAMVEGLAAQQVLVDLEQADADAQAKPRGRPMDPDLASKALLSIFVSMIDAPWTTGVPEVLKRLDQARTNSPD